MNKNTSIKINSKDINRYISITRDSLLPESTLQSVGDNWGITRERVRQIFLKATKKHYSVVRKDLLKNNTKYVCPICGTPRNPRSNSIYCGRECYKLSVYYDWEHPKICKYCKRQFFPYNNWKSSSVYKKSLFGQYCCAKHYMLHRSRKKGIFSKDSAILKKFKHLGKKKKK